MLEIITVPYKVVCASHTALTAYLDETINKLENLVLK